MKKLLLITVLFVVVSFNSFAQQKETKVVEIKGTKVEKSRGENPNIKTDFVCNAPDVEVAKPDASRGLECQVNIDNYTGYSVKIFVDGNFYGWIHAWSDANVTVYNGYKTIYCITAGESYEWKASGNCDSYFHYQISTTNAR